MQLGKGMKRGKECLGDLREGGACIYALLKHYAFVVVYTHGISPPPLSGYCISKKNNGEHI